MCASAIEIGGSATLSSRDSILFSSVGSLFAQGSFVTLTADSDGVGGGGITLIDGSTISAGVGSIALLATGDITLGRLITSNGTSSAVRVVSSAGSVRDGGDSGGADITASAPGAVVTIQAALGVGTAGNALDLDVRHLAVTTTNSDQFLAEQDGLESLRLQAGLGNVTLAAAGSILDGDTELDVQAQNLVLRALAVGSVISPLETQVATLTAQLSGGGLELVEHDGLTVLAVTALAGNIGLKSLSGDLQLVSLQANGLVTLQTPAGAVLRGGELPLTITAAQLEIAASGGAGTSASTVADNRRGAGSRWRHWRGVCREYRRPGDWRDCLLAAGPQRPESKWSPPHRLHPRLAHHHRIHPHHPQRNGTPRSVRGRVDLCTSRHGAGISRYNGRTRSSG